MAKIESGIKSIVLAAGDSVRMGFPKALLPLGDGFFITHVLDTLDEAGFEESIVVLGRHAPHIEPLIRERSVRILINKNPDRGQVSSLQLAIQSLDSHCDGCLMWPVDQPLVSAQVVEGLVALFHNSNALIVHPTCADRRGHPVIFRRSLFWELLHCPIEAGARSVLMKHLNETATLPTSETGTVTDVDTPMDYFNLTGHLLDTSHPLEN